MHSIIEKKIFAANANPDLAASIAAHLGRKLGQSSVTKFPDTEIKVSDLETVRGADVFIVQSTSPPVNDHLMELLIMIDAMRRSSAERITAVIPYYGYARQDRKARSREPISAKLVADLLTEAGANRILTMDLHSPQIQGFFNIPLDHLKGMNLFAEYIWQSFGDLSDVVVVSPDVGSVANCKEFADLLAKIQGQSVPLAITNKQRHSANETEVTHFIGDVEGKIAILLDDVLTTGTTLCNAVEVIKSKKPKAIYACITHPVLIGDAVRLIQESALDEIVLLDTIAIRPEVPYDPISLELTVNSHFTDIPRLRKPAGQNTGNKIKVLSTAKLFADAIDCIHFGKPIGKLFELNLQR